jgi:hypothetical protein
MTLTPDRRFRLVNDYAIKKGYVSGFPNFQEADHGQGIIFGGIFLLPARVAEWRDVPRDTYGVYHIEEVPALFRGAAAYAASHNYPGAYPNCHQQDHGGGVLYGTILIKPGMAQWKDVPRATLGNPAINDVGAMMRGASDYALANGFAAGFPTFDQADHGSGVVYGVVLISAGNADWRDVPITGLYLLDPKDERTCVILCKFRDATGALLPEMARADFYRQYFFGVGIGGLHDYYADVSHGRVNLIGDVFGWFDIGHTVDEHKSKTGGAQRQQAFTWGLDAARQNGVDVDRYSHQVVIVNVDTDWGAIGLDEGMVLPHSPTSQWSHSRAMHEFGHVLGVTEAYRTRQVGGTTVDDPYQDQHCIMSYATSGSRFNMTLLGQVMEAGPGLNGVYTHMLDGIPATRLYDVPAQGAAVTVELAPLTHADEDGFLLVRINPTAGRPNTYWVELHDRSNWDRAIPFSRVAVHETREGDIRSFVLEVDGIQSLHSPNDKAFITPDGSIGVAYVNQNGLNASVRIWELGPNRRQEVRIVSVVYNPPGDDVVGERVIIRNDRLTAINMKGWILRDDSKHPKSSPWRFVFPDFF